LYFSQGFQILPLMHHCSRELTAVKIKTLSGGGPREIILRSAYLPYDDVDHSAWRDLPGHRHGKLFIGRPCKKRADDLLKLSRHQIKW
jgi:hypothetical protein